MNPKTLYRLSFVSKNALRQVLVAVFGMAVPFLVIAYNNKELWGSFVSLLLFSLFAVQVINWGGKEYLLRQFSAKPSGMVRDFSRIFFTRLQLVLFFGCVAFVVFPTIYGWLILIWLTGRFFQHAVEPLVLFEKRFNGVMAVETLAFAALCICLYAWRAKLDLLTLLVLYGLYQMAKGIGTLWLFKKYLRMVYFKTDWAYFTRGFSFFLISIVGFAGSKMDVYVVERFGDARLTSDYQIINGLLVFTMSIAALLYAPFTKNMYRTQQPVVGKMRRILAISGLLVVPAALLSIHFIVMYFLDVPLSFAFHVVAFLYVYPSFLYGIEIVYLFKLRQETMVVRYLLCGIVANAALSFVLLDRYGTLTAALSGSAVAQILVLVLFSLNKPIVQNTPPSEFLVQTNIR